MLAELTDWRIHHQVPLEAKQTLHPHARTQRSTWQLHVFFLGMAKETNNV